MAEGARVKEWKYGVHYHKDGDLIVLYQEPFWVSAVKRTLDTKLVLFSVGYVPGAYGLFSKLLFWLDEKEDVILRIPATAEMLAKLAPDLEWLWGEDWSDDGDSEPAPGR